MRKCMTDFDWSSLNEDTFVHLVADLLRAAGHDIKYQGDGPDGGIDLITSQRVV